LKRYSKNLNQRIKLSLLIGLIVILLSSCGSQQNNTGKTVSFSTDVAPILNQRCIGCHGDGQPSAGLDLSTYEGVMAGARGKAIVVAGNPSKSLLVTKVRSGKMPKNGAKLTPEQISLINDWVSQGALDN
jgi:uncharacterized membrane protein